MSLKDSIQNLFNLFQGKFGTPSSGAATPTNIDSPAADNSDDLTSWDVPFVKT